VRARALDDGALGDTIRVLNMQSNRVIETRIIGVNHVEAIPASASLTVVTN
jgi:flagella basal body P-ring formation protein FlgA